MNATITLTNKLRGVASMSNAIINGGASPYPKHVGPAAICSFSDGAQDAPLKSLAFTIEPNQSGSGDPSPSNIRPISGWTQVDGKQSGEDMSDYTPITISLGQTVYGGTVDALNGKMVIDSKSLDLGSLSYTYNSTYGIFIGTTPDDSVPINDPKVYNAITSMYRNNTGVALNLMENGDFEFNTSRISSSGKRIALKNTAYTDPALFKTAMSGQTLVYPLATPIEVDLTPVSVSSLLGQNNVWANTGDTELDYYPAAASVVAVLNRSSKVYTSIPLGKIRYDTYQTTPNQALDLDSYRAETGVLIRNVLSHTATKIEFNTPSMTNAQWEEVWNIIKAGFNNSTERKLKLKYYDQMSATYKTGWFYVPDVNFTIRNIDEANGIINYDEVRVAFIEY